MKNKVEINKSATFKCSENKTKKKVQKSFFKDKYEVDVLYVQF